MASVAVPAVSAAAAGAGTACSHCGLVVPPGLVEHEASLQFCCAGCRVAHAILHEHGLRRYYDLPERRARAVVSTGRQYEEFDHATFHELYVTRDAAGTARVELLLEGVHCASCVWLVERVPLVIDGVIRAELNVRRSVATVEWDPAAVSLSAIARQLDALGYAPHPFRGVRREEVRRREDRTALTRIGVAGALAMNVMLASLALYSGWWSGMEASYERFFRWISLLLTAPAIVGPGRVFFTSAFAALRTRTLHMDLPIALALGAGFARGALNTVTDSGPIYFDGVAMLVFLLLCGRYLQQRGNRAASDAAELLHSLTPANARLVSADGTVRDVPVEAVVPGQLLEVRSGETFAADGTVAEGTSSVNLALLTGESRPVTVRQGGEVYAGTLNMSAPVRVRVTQAGAASRVARLLQLVDEHAQRRAPIVLLADRMAGWFTATVIVLAAIAFSLWRSHGVDQALDHAVALLIVTCPCALALATPLTVAAALGRAARAGIFIKGGSALELLSRPARVLLDKTGTITESRVALIRWTGPDWVKPLVSSLERGSSHPIAAAIRAAFPEHDAPLATRSRHVVGGGVEGDVDGHHVVFGSPRFVSEVLCREDAAPNCRPSLSRGAANHDHRDEALTPVWIAVDGAVVASAGFADAVREDAREAIDGLRARGWKVGVLTGDHADVALSVAKQMDIDAASVVAGATPEEKLRVVEAMTREGPVIMVGDGVNDAAALAAASVGIAVHGGAEAAFSTADVYLTKPGLGALVELSDGARRAMATIRRGIAFSLAYNVVGASLAMAGVISPLIAALLMPASSLTVLWAAWRGRSFQERTA